MDGVIKLESALEETALEQKIDFESWFAMRKKDIPTQHREEIIRADFKARKLPGVATMAEFDDALKKYGIRLG